MKVRLWVWAWGTQGRGMVHVCFGGLTVGGHYEKRVYIQHMMSNKAEVHSGVLYILVESTTLYCTHYML
jgi:hypothetical protein